MSEKPVLVLIGESHPHTLEAMLRSRGKLKVKIKESKNGQRVIADIKADKGETKRLLQRINKEILQEEVQILRKEGIKRLFYEAEDSEKRKKIYARFKETRNIEQVRSELREEHLKGDMQKKEDVKKYLSKTRIHPLIKAVFETYFENSKGLVHSMFGLSHITVAHKAGIVDIVPVENDQCFRQAGVMLEILNMKEFAFRSLSGTDPALLKALGIETIIEVQNELNQLSNTAKDKLASIDPKREKSVCRNISENYASGSALLCGAEHVKPLKELLSKKFTIRAHIVGEELRKSCS